MCQGPGVPYVGICWYEELIHVRGLVMGLGKGRKFGFHTPLGWVQGLGNYYIGFKVGA